MHTIETQPVLLTLLHTAELGQYVASSASRPTAPVNALHGNRATVDARSKKLFPAPHLYVPFSLPDLLMQIFGPA